MHKSLTAPAKEICRYDAEFIQTKPQTKKKRETEICNTSTRISAHIPYLKSKISSTLSCFWTYD